MVSAAELAHDDDAPPESGTRLRARPATVEPARPIAGAAEIPENVRDAELLVEVGREVVGDVLELTRAISPLQGAWLGPVQLGVAALRSLLVRRDARPWRLGERWTELVPGFAAMDRLAHLMVDCLC